MDRQEGHEVPQLPVQTGEGSAQAKELGTRDVSGQKSLEEGQSPSTEGKWDWLFDQDTAGNSPSAPSARRSPKPKGRSPRGKGKVISLNLPIETLERLQRLAERKGIGYQTYMKILLHEALENEERFYPPITER